MSFERKVNRKYVSGMFQQNVRDTEIFEDLRSSSGEDSYYGSYGQ